FGCLEGRTEITLPAGADQSVDFTYIKDISRAICLVYEAPDLKHRQYNACGGVCYTIPELIGMVAEQAGVKVDLSIGPGRIMPRGPSLDSTRLREELGFSPQYDIVSGLREYIEWMRTANKRT
ncbi:MAG: NAD(P)-dependent oxidoreductase, partial [Syntrophobacteraceae bacterium]